MDNERYERGCALAATADICKVKEIPSSIVGRLDVWRVESERIKGKYYTVILMDTGICCSCPDFVRRGLTCKHCYSVIIKETQIENNVH